MAKVAGKKDTEVIGVTFSHVALRRVDALCDKGTHGTSRTEVIRSLVEEGIRQAIKDGFIKLDEGVSSLHRPA